MKSAATGNAAGGMKQHKNTLFWEFVRRNLIWLALSFLILGLSGLVRTYSASYVLKITDLIESRAGLARLLGLTVTGFLVIGSSYVLRWMGAVLCMWMTERLALHTRDKLARHLAHVPFIHYEKLDVGQMQTVLRGDVSRSSQLIYTLFSRILQNILLFVFTLGYMAMIHLPMALIVSALSIAMAAANQRILSKQKKYEKASRDAVGEVSETVLAACRGMDTIKTYGAEGFILSLLRAAKARFNRSAYKAQTVDAGRLTVYNIASNVTLYASILYFGYEGIRGNISVGEVLVFILLLRQIMIPVEVIFRWMSRIVQSGAAWERIYELLDLPQEAPASVPDPAPAHSVEARDIRFSFGGEADVLRGVTIALKKGELTALDGKSGCGKTTLYKVLTGLYSGARAYWRIDGEPAQPGSFADWAILSPAQTQLFSMSLYENITLGDESISREDCMALADRLGFGEWIRSLPNGLDTLADSGGRALSGGQRQVVCTMRALLSAKPVLILDEVFSALDAEHRERLMDYLLAIRNERLILLTTHQREFVERCGQVVTMGE